VISAIERNIYNFFILIGKKAERELNTSGMIKWIKAAPSVWPNYLFDANYKDPNILLDHIKRQVKSGMAPSQWFLGPGAINNDLINSMIKHGCFMIGRWPGMAVELENVNRNFTFPKDLRIVEISDDYGLAQFDKIVSTAMFGGGCLGVDLVESFFNDENIHLYMALLDGTAVATSLLFTSAGIAGLYLISTLPKYRNMGIGKKITQVTLKAAKKLGYKIGGLFATELGEKVYRRLGFKRCGNFDIYCIV
jgi:GNAT superfamily N-acetyltransferase